jgi:hypothetical protein
MSCVADVVCQCPGLSALQRADGENRSENRGGSLAAIIADFCNKIGTLLPRANAAAYPQLAKADFASSSQHVREAQRIAELEARAA